MQILKMVAEVKAYIRGVKAVGKSVGFVPTMGYLHEGHLTLMREAKANCDVVIVSIFINPLQFGVGEDFEEYPRDLTRDAELCQSVGIGAIFAPAVAEMYPKGYHTFVDMEELPNHLCGLARPGHFRGVSTVVSKLFNIVQPDKAFFGQKDAQQALIIKRLAADLNMNLEIVIVPIVREEDGLAMSSRNVYLTPEERQAAPVLYQSLQQAKAAIEAGETKGEAIRNLMINSIQQQKLAKIDYVEVVSRSSLEGLDRLEGEVLIAVAVCFGKTRLIDNIMLNI
ncbi:MAG: pantoate--beta-alanine ligase [Carboxydocellales bacterium]